MTLFEGETKTVAHRQELKTASGNRNKKDNRQVVKKVDTLKNIIRPYISLGKWGLAYMQGRKGGGRLVVW